MMSKADNPAAHTSRSHHPHDPKTALSSGSLADAEVAAQTFLDILDLHQGPGVYLVLAPSGEARQRLMAHWRNLAQTRGHRVVTVPYTSQSRAQDLLTLVGQTQERDVIFVDLDDELSWATANPTGLLPDLDQRVQQARQSLQSLNLARERLRRLPAPLFFWMSPEVLRAFARYAADLFAVRSGLLDVLGSPPARARATATDIERPEPKIPWLTHYDHLFREEREGRLRLLLEALEREAPNLYRLARYHLDAAEILGSLEQYERALHHAQQALDLARKVNDPALQAASWLAIGQGLAALGRYDEALRAIQEAEALFEQVGDSLKRAHTLHQMANIHRVRGDLDRTLDLYRQSLDIFERLGDQRGKAATLHEMAYIYRLRGDLERALDLYRQSLEIKERLGDLRGKAAALREIANIYATRGDLDRALDLYLQSLEIAEILGDLRGKAATLHEIASIFVLRGDLDRALRLYEQARDILERLGELRGKAAALREIANIYATRGDLDRALDLYLQSLEIAERLGDLWGKAAALREIANIYATRGDLKAAIRTWQETLRIPYLPSDLREKIQADIFQAVQNIEDEDARAELQAALAPYLPEEARLQRPDDEETRTTDAHRGERTDTDLSGS